MKYRITDFLEETARTYPHKIAFADLDSKITWEDFVVEAKKRAISISVHFAPGSPVPIMCEKSVETLCLFFGAIYAGCYYCFLDATFPDSRLDAMLETLQAPYFLTEEKHRKKAELLHTPALFIEEMRSPDETTVSVNKRLGQTIDTDPVYANFTSGSTGIPKAVLVSHRSVIDFITCFTELFSITAEDSIANQAPFDFDVSVKDIFSGVFTGASVHLVPRQYFSFPVKLLDYLEERNVTTLIWAVSALCIISTLNGFSYKVPSKLKKIMFSGEVMPIKHLNKWRKYVPDAEYVNLYGPTEITCNCMYYRIDREYSEEEMLPLGECFPNERVFLLDEQNQLVTTADVLGEICVTGTCLAIGYYNNPKTEEVFVQNPLKRERFDRMYRTGDLARYDNSMRMYYVSRKDTQIKHMGHRIELGEIELAIGKHVAVSRSCCVFTGNKIHAFYTGEGTDKKEMVNFLKDTLPAYMIPSTFNCIDAFPLTKNGKIDKRGLEAQCND